MARNDGINIKIWHLEANKIEEPQKYTTLKYKSMKMSRQDKLELSQVI